MFGTFKIEKIPTNDNVLQVDTFQTITRLNLIVSFTSKPRASPDSYVLLINIHLKTHRVTSKWGMFFGDAQVTGCEYPNQRCPLCSSKSMTSSHLERICNLVCPGSCTEINLVKSHIHRHTVTILRVNVSAGHGFNYLYWGWCEKDHGHRG